MSAEPTLVERLNNARAMRHDINATSSSNRALNQLFLDAAARLDGLERQLENAQHWRERHCRESEQHAQRSGDNWKAWKAAERQLAAVAQTEREKIVGKVIESTERLLAQAKEKSGLQYEVAVAFCEEYIPAIRNLVLAPHAAKEPEAAQAVANESESATERRTPTITTEPAPASGPDGEDCTGEPDEQFIEAILVEKSELNRLRAVAEAAKTFIHSEGRENIVAAELALVNAIEQSYS
jgi:DNA-binding ferritin-like protein (Dps family)